MGDKPYSQQMLTLADKWMQGTITEEEKKIFVEWYNAFDDRSLSYDLSTPPALKEEIYNAIQQKINVDTPATTGRVGNWRHTWQIAAAVITIAFITIAIVLFNKQPNVQQNVTSAIKPTPVKETQSKAVSYIRTIILPDSSTVVLQANSSLIYPDTFAGNTREVTLTGEAYFDIKHLSTPFIIHTAKVNTTVLGTAFNIKTDSNAAIVTVSVIRGKVKVEEGGKKLAVLTANQQIRYNTTQSKSIETQVPALTATTDWTKRDMEFEDVSFQTVADLLSRRYGVEIGFKNAALAKCTIKAFFNGLEPLEGVLKSLCTISNSVYTKLPDNNILLDGEGCSN